MSCPSRTPIILSHVACEFCILHWSCQQVYEHNDVICVNSVISFIIKYHSCDTATMQTATAADAPVIILTATSLRYSQIQVKLSPSYTRIYTYISKDVELYPIRSATPRTCSSMIPSHFIYHVAYPEAILSEIATKFSSHKWEETLSDFNIMIRHSFVRHSEANPSKHCMRELNKYLELYCDHSQRKRPELPEYTAGYSPLELTYDFPKPDTFKRLLPTGPRILTEEKTREDKAIRA